MKRDFFNRSCAGVEVETSGRPEHIEKIQAKIDQARALLLRFFGVLSEVQNVTVDLGISVYEARKPGADVKIVLRGRGIEEIIDPEDQRAVRVGLMRIFDGLGGEENLIIDLDLDIREQPPKQNYAFI